MKKAVLISIQPKWVRLIVSGEKTVEIRKTCPKLETPFKCYIYETKGHTWQNKNEPKMQEGNGRVLGEFVCDICTEFTQDYYELSLVSDGSCVPMDELKAYLGAANKNGYVWHISNLKMYDKPKQIQDFYRIGVESCRKCDICWYHDYPIDEEPCVSCHLDRDYLWRAPQSWCYVEELE